MLYDCCRNFVSFYSQSMIEFTFTLHNAVVRKRYLTIQSATFTVDIEGFQTDWQLICTSNALILLKAFDNVIIYILATCHEQMYHLQLYWAHSIATLPRIPRNVSFIVCTIENWSAFIVSLYIKALYVLLQKRLHL